MNTGVSRGFNWLFLGTNVIEHHSHRSGFFYDHFLKTIRLANQSNHVLAFAEYAP